MAFEQMLEHARVQGKLRYRRLTNELGFAVHVYDRAFVYVALAAWTLTLGGLVHDLVRRRS